MIVKSTLTNPQSASSRLASREHLQKMMVHIHERAQKQMLAWFLCDGCVLLQICFYGNNIETSKPLMSNRV